MNPTRIEHSHPEHNDWFVVNWCLGNTCTYECSYCPKGLHDGSVAWPELDTVLTFIELMERHVRPLKKSLYLELTGGEVTVWKDFLHVAQFCRDLDIRLGFISNGSRSLRWWEDNKAMFDHVCLSFHPEFADRDHFLDVVRTLSRDLRVHVNVMMKPDQFNYCYETATKIKDIGNISIALQPLIVDFGDKLFDYTEQQHRVFGLQHQLLVQHIKWEKGFPFYRGAMRVINEDGTTAVKAAHRFIEEKQNNWWGWDCYAGVEQIVVDMAGNIRRGWCGVGEDMGTITAPKFTNEPVVCTKSMCHCNYDIMSTKVRVPRTGAMPGRVVPIHPVQNV